MNTPLTGALLAQDRIDRHRSMGAFGKPAWQSHVQLRAMLRQRLGERCAHYFATPSFDADAGVIRWTAHSNAPVRGWHELSPEEQGAHALDMESIRGQLIGFAAELRNKSGDKGGGQPGGAAAFASLLEQAMKVPADGHFLYLVGDQPVIAFWGFETQAGGSVDPAVASAPDFRQPVPAAAAVAAAPALLPATEAAPRRRPWWWWLLALLAALLLLLLLLGLLRGCGPAAGLALPGMAGPEGGASAPGVVAPGALPGASGVPGGPLGVVPGTAPGMADPALPGASAAPDGSATLPPGAASAVPLPGAGMPPTPGQEPPPDPQKDPQKDPAKDPATDPKNPDAARTNPPLPPSAPGAAGAGKPDPKADAKADPKAMKLPPDAAAASRKMDFLQGDWKAGDGLVDQSTKQPLDMALKFGPDGRGELSLRRPDGTVCSGPVQGQMKDGKLSIQGQQAVPCSNGGSYGAPRIECAKTSGGQTDCFGVNADGSRYYMDMKRR